MRLGGTLPLQPLRKPVICGWDLLADSCEDIIIATDYKDAYQISMHVFSSFKND